MFDGLETVVGQAEVLPRQAQVPRSSLGKP